MHEQYYNLYLFVIVVGIERTTRNDFGIKMLKPRFIYYTIFGATKRIENRLTLRQGIEPS